MHRQQLTVDLLRQQVAANYETHQRLALIDRKLQAAETPDEFYKVCQLIYRLDLDRVPARSSLLAGAFAAAAEACPVMVPVPQSDALDALRQLLGSDTTRTRATTSLVESALDSGAPGGLYDLHKANGHIRKKLRDNGCRRYGAMALVFAIGRQLCTS